MADASGLTAAQADANQIPYKNIALGNPAETFLNAWALSTGLKLKQQEFEGKMQALQQKNAQIEADSAMKDKLNEMKLYGMQQGVGLREGALQLKQDIFDEKVGDRKKMQDSVSGISRDFASLDANPLDPDYMSKIDNILGNPDYQYAPPSFYTQARNNKARLQQNAVINARRGIESDTKAWQHGVSSQLWGNIQNTDTNPVLHPELYPDVPGELTDEQKAGLTWQQRLGVPGYPKPEAPSTGMKQIQQYVNGKPVGKPRIISSQWLTDQARRYQQIQDRVSSLPSVDKGTYQTQPLPTTKQQMQAGVVYQTDQGDLRWTGTQFVPP
jgi:hypothetical protein